MTANRFSAGLLGCRLNAASFPQVNEIALPAFGSGADRDLVDLTPDLPITPTKPGLLVAVAVMGEVGT